MRRKMLCLGLFLGALGILFQPAAADDPPPWIDDYGVAMQKARTEGKVMLIHFYDESTENQLERVFASDATLTRRLDSYVLTKLPLLSTVTVGGEEIRLINHPAFAEMQRRPGLAMIDMRDPQNEHYMRVVTVFPGYQFRQLDAHRMAILLTLPSGSLTQRTLIYAVRTHLERPQSTSGRFHPVLANESRSHSAYQASIASLGHHNFDGRANRIQSRVPGGMVQEVCAESWGGQGLVDAAIECVNSWRTSAGHWGAVRSWQSYYGYDMQQGFNGVWYATGIFVR